MDSPVGFHLTQAALLDDLLRKGLKGGKALQSVRQAERQCGLGQGHRGAQIAEQGAEQHRGEQLESPAQLKVVSHFDSMIFTMFAYIQIQLLRTVELSG